MIAKFTTKHTMRLLKILVLAASTISLLPVQLASAQLAACINQCDSIGYQCAQSENYTHERCLANQQEQDKACQRSARDKERWCVNANQYSCHLWYENELTACRRHIQACTLDGQRCEADARVCIKRCENEVRPPVASAPILRKPRPTIRKAPTKPKIVRTEYFKFEQSDQVNEFQYYSDAKFRVRNLKKKGRQGDWHDYTRTDGVTFKATKSNAIYIIISNDRMLWTNEASSIFLTRQSE